MSQPRHKNNLELFNAELAILLNKYGFGIENLDTVSVIISQKNGLPCVFLRKNTINQAQIKALISAAYHSKPIIVMPRFSDKVRSIGTALEKGILTKNTKGGYNFTF